MRVQVQKWGNSLAPRILKPFAEETAMREGSVVNLAVARGRLVATPVTRNSGVVLADQVKSLDWRARKAEFACRLPKGAVIEVLQKLATLIAPDPG